jgi:hypothetical protein
VPTSGRIAIASQLVGDKITNRSPPGGWHTLLWAGRLAEVNARLQDIEAAVRPDDIHCPRTRLICLENTHSASGGVPLTAEYTRRAADDPRRFRLVTHAWISPRDIPRAVGAIRDVLAQ